MTVEIVGYGDEDPSDNSGSHTFYVGEPTNPTEYDLQFFYVFPGGPNASVTVGPNTYVLEVVLISDNGYAWLKLTMDGSDDWEDTRVYDGEYGRSEDNQVFIGCEAVLPDRVAVYMGGASTWRIGSATAARRCGCCSRKPGSRGS